eukprot:Sspe_Gene.86221::Locus_56939_Transcript_3_3_Confidence_0.500_Length_1343::g.86221::m.86221
MAWPVLCTLPRNTASTPSARSRCSKSAGPSTATPLSNADHRTGLGTGRSSLMHKVRTPPVSSRPSRRTPTRARGTHSTPSQAALGSSHPLDDHPLTQGDRSLMSAVRVGSLLPPVGATLPLSCPLTAHDVSRTGLTLQLPATVAHRGCTTAAFLPNLRASTTAPAGHRRLTPCSAYLMTSHTCPSTSRPHRPRAPPPPLDVPFRSLESSRVSSLSRESTAATKAVRHAGRGGRRGSGRSHKIRPGAVLVGGSEQGSGAANEAHAARQGSCNAVGDVAGPGGRGGENVRPCRYCGLWQPAVYFLRTAYLPQPA